MHGILPTLRGRGSWSSIGGCGGVRSFCPVFFVLLWGSAKIVTSTGGAEPGRCSFSFPDFCQQLLHPVFHLFPELRDCLGDCEEWLDLRLKGRNVGFDGRDSLFHQTEFLVRSVVGGLLGQFVQSSVDCLELGSDGYGNGGSIGWGGKFSYRRSRLASLVEMLLA